MSATGQPPRSLAVPPLRVRTDDGRTFRFVRPFTIGRESDCDVRIDHAQVSRKHVIVSFGNGRWRFRDQRSGNGVFIDGQRVDSTSIDSGLTIQLGADGPTVVMELGPQALPQAAPALPPVAAGETRIVASYAEKYFGATTDDEPAGGRTLMIRKAFKQVQKKQQRAYGGILAVVALAAVSAAGYAYYGHRQLAQQQAVALDLFYSMKTLDVQLAEIERRLAASGEASGQDQVKAYLARRAEDLEDEDKAAAAKFKAASTHWLRHTFATMALRQGLALPSVQRMLGHANLTTTSGYVTAEQEALQADMERFAGLAAKGG